MSDVRTWRDEVSGQIGQMSGKVDGLVESHQELKDKLMGNGRPGIIQDIYSRLRYLDRLLWIGYGIVMTVIVVGSALAFVHDGNASVLMHILEALAK